MIEMEIEMEGGSERDRERNNGTVMTISRDCWGQERCNSRRLKLTGARSANVARTCKPELH